MVIIFSDVNESNANEVPVICFLTAKQESIIEVVRSLDMVFFSILALHWAMNAILMIFWTRLRTRMRQRVIIAVTLYTIVGIIIVGRMIEVNSITVYD